MASIEQIEQWSAELNELLKPYRREASRRGKVVSELEQCLRVAKRDDPFALAELLDDKAIEALTADAELGAGAPLLRHLQAHAHGAIELYQTSFREELLRLAGEAGVPMTVDFPRFASLRGIEGQVDFAKRAATVNGKTLPSVDPRRIVAQVVKLKRQLYDAPLDPAAFLEELFGVYSAALKARGEALGQPLGIQDLYRELVFSRQSKRFWQDMDRRAFKGYGLDALAVDLWRTFEAGVFTVASGHTIQLRSGRSHALWLIDRDGERRQITSITFTQAP